MANIEKMTRNHGEYRERIIFIHKEIMELMNDNDIPQKDKDRLIKNAKKKIKRLENKIIEIESHCEWYEW